jgi:ATP-dependent DNA ligase
MRLAVLREPFDHADFVFEVKYDGFRAIADITKQGTRLISRRRIGSSNAIAAGVPSRRSTSEPLRLY